jgi:hypothetical protein
MKITGKSYTSKSDSGQKFPKFVDNITLCNPAKKRLR